MDAEFDRVVDDHGMEESKRRLILEGPLRTFPGNASVTQYFQACIAEGRIQGDGTAIIDEEKHHTFREFDLFSTKLARIIRIELGGVDISTSNPDGDIVIGLCLPPSDKLLLSIFAILKLGAAYLPFDIHFPEDRVIRIVENSKPVLIITDPHGPIIAKFNPVVKVTKVMDIDTLISKVLDVKINASLNLVEPVPGLASKAERVAIVLYTSGSSGEPKGVRLTHRTIMNRLYWQWKQFPFRANERCCFKTALTFVDSVAEIFAPLLQGHSITVFGKHITAHPNILIQRIADCKITRFVLVPSLLRSILATTDVIGDVAKKDLKSIMLWICSGETLTRDLLEDFFVNFPTGATICNFYGSTEIMGDVTFEVFESQKDVEDKVEGVHTPIGRCVFNTIVYVLDENMGLTRDGELGELYIAGHNLCSGYVGTAGSDKFVMNPFTKTIGFNRLFRTGDFGRLKRANPNAPGVLFYEGRLDSQVKVRGQRVDTGEIEATLAGISDMIETVIVLVYHRDQDDQTLVAFIQPKAKDITEARIDMVMKTKLKPAELPEIRLIQEVPLLVNGKVNRQRLLQQYEDRRMNRTQFDDWQSLNILPEFITGAIALIQTISQVTGTSEHDIVKDLDDSFYNLGGTSLNSILVISKLRFKRFQIAIADFVGAPTIRDMFPLLQPAVPGTMVATPRDREAFGGHGKYYSERIDNLHKADVQNIIAYSFSHKGDLEVYTDATYDEFSTLIDQMWHPLLIAGFSFVVRRSSNKKIIAASINFDVVDEPNVPAPASIQKVFDFLEFIESKQREKLPKGRRKLWHSFMMGTHEEVDESENVSLVLFMEEENIRRAKDRHFTGLLTTNTNPLTQQVCEDLLGYEQLVSFQVNTYVAEDESMPFRLAPDSQVAVCCWKKLEYYLTSSTAHVAANADDPAEPTTVN